MGEKYERFGKNILIRIDRKITNFKDTEGETVVFDEIERRAIYPEDEDMPPRRYDTLVDLADLIALRDIINDVIEEIEFETKTFHKFPLLIENEKAKKKQ